MNQAFPRPDQAPAVFLDDATPGREQLTRFAGALGVIRADRPEEVPGAFAAMERARTGGHHLAGYFSYELGYLLETRLRPLLPAARGRAAALVRRLRAGGGGAPGGAGAAPMPGRCATNGTPRPITAGSSACAATSPTATSTRPNLSFPFALRLRRRCARALRKPARAVERGLWRLPRRWRAGRSSPCRRSCSSLWRRTEASPPSR